MPNAVTDLFNCVETKRDKRILFIFILIASIHLVESLGNLFPMSVFVIRYIVSGKCIIEFDGEDRPFHQGHYCANVINDKISGCAHRSRKFILPGSTK